MTTVRTTLLPPPATFYFTQGDWGANVSINAPSASEFQIRPPVIAPATWNTTSVRVVVDKYLLPCDDNNIFNMVRRVVHRIATFSEPDDAVQFEEDLFEIVINQKATWNSPVWFNVGNPQQVSKNDEQAWACLILGVDDYMEETDGPESIVSGWVSEGKTFRRGSGSGVNLSRLRAKGESLSGGTGVSSGPISLWMRPTDSIAGVVSSGGRTRRAAKMIIMDADHPDVLEFVNVKARENKRAKDLLKMGYDITLNGVDSESLDFQNANNSVRVTDAFMRAVENDEPWSLKARHDDWEKPFPGGARALWKAICDAAADCADPGIQFHDTTNAWNSCINDGEIVASNPCSEYLWLNNTVCNLSSINLKKFIDIANQTFDIAEFIRVVNLMTRSMDILCDITSHINPYIKEQALRYRTLGLGFSNLGASLMALGIPYDSNEGRAFAGAVTSLMQAAAYRQSADLAKNLGSYSRFDANRVPQLNVIRKHADASLKVHSSKSITNSIVDAANSQWFIANTSAEQFGVRNAQVSVIAPTGTISFMMGCETTGVEPLFALSVKKELVGGGSLDLAAQDCVNEGLQAVFGNSIPDDWQMHPVFATAAGVNAISPEAHVDMICAVQPFISGGISKTINLPAGSGSDDVARAYMRGWKNGSKALAVYIDGSKPFQPLTTSDNKEEEKEQDEKNVAEIEYSTPQLPYGRRKMPGIRSGVTHKFTVGGEHEFYLTSNFYPTGELGEIFIEGGKEGTAFSGMMKQWAIAVSMALQSGISFDDLKSKFVHQRFDPNGIVQSESPIKFCSSIPDYVFRWLEWYISETNKEFSLDRYVPSVVTTDPEATPKKDFSQATGVAEQCPQCNALELRQIGTCWICKNCLWETGCG